MYHHIAMMTAFNGRAPSMLAMTLVNLAALENYEAIPSTAWTGEYTCSYNTLLIHSKKLKAVLEQSDEFPNLKSRKIGK
jgi:hypothetical protein